jgi:hypothetical protein
MIDPGFNTKSNSKRGDGGWFLANCFRISSFLSLASGRSYSSMTIVSSSSSMSSAFLGGKVLMTVAVSYMTVSSGMNLRMKSLNSSTELWHIDSTVSYIMKFTT